MLYSKLIKQTNKTIKNYKTKFSKNGQNTKGLFKFRTSCTSYS